VRRELVQQLEPHDVSWMAVRGADDFSKLTDYELAWRADARRFEFVTVPFQDLAAMNASLELVLELGPKNVSRHALGLAQVIADWAQHRSDVKLVTPASADRRAAVMSVRPEDARAASERLTAANVAHSLREGAIRLSPHFYNTRDEVERALEIIAR
jgi:selenocysteine lyase/cysteine desulfurase